MRPAEWDRNRNRLMLHEYPAYGKVALPAFRRRVVTVYVSQDGRQSLLRDRHPARYQINVFSGRILEIEGFSNLKVEQGFKLSDAAAWAAALNKEPMVEYMRSNITLLKADANAQYAVVIEIDLAEVTDPILACSLRPLGNAD